MGFFPITDFLILTESAGKGWRGLSGPSPTVYLSGLLLEPSICMKDHTASLLPPPPQLPHQASKSADLHTLQAPWMLPPCVPCSFLATPGQASGQPAPAPLTQALSPVLRYK